ncbi:hypothetical protein BC829DRAFT_449197 [Chytridium lagenaria]|nr:hypothetical protein BC829DRAFT_449197 [Chytridium lagenaria]
MSHGARDRDPITPPPNIQIMAVAEASKIPPIVEFPPDRIYNNKLEAGNGAEKLCLTVGETDPAIMKYKNQKYYDHIIRLVTAYHKDLLIETYLYLGKTLEMDTTHN